MRFHACFLHAYACSPDSFIRHACLSEEALFRNSIVAVHGIGAAPDDTWCKPVHSGSGQESEDKYVNWLQDDRMLPSIVPNACIMRYGYELNWFGKDALHTKVTDIARTLLRSLRRHQKVGQNAKLKLFTK